MVLGHCQNRASSEKEVDIWSGVTNPDRRTHGQTLKESATQLLRGFFKIQENRLVTLLV